MVFLRLPNKETQGLETTILPSPGGRRRYSVNPVIASEAISVVAGSRRLQSAQNVSLRLCAPALLFAVNNMERPSLNIYRQAVMKFFHESEDGFSLVELMVALIIIALVIVGGGMFFFHGRVNVIREAHRRAALLVASQRLEALKAANWDDIALDPPSYQLYYITYSSGWVKNMSETKDTEVPVDNLSDGEMVTEAQWIQYGELN